MTRFFLALALVLIPTLTLAGERTYGDLFAVVISVYDGDTMTVSIPDVHPLLGDGISIRVRGIDTPEMKDQRPEIHAMAVLARDMVRGLCPSGSTVELRGVGRDKYFRIDATPVCGGVDVAAELVKAGLAHGDYEGGTKVAW
ncbi:thermonuclease family protein [Solidesulfovibrio carbinoliphilus]|nr:thermonuclease family protein [Solidesulfovibrio carbinoliphilus]